MALKFFVLFSLVVFLLILEKTKAEKIPLGAVFEQGTSEVQTAFKYALMNHNTNDKRDELLAYVDIINTADAFKLSRIICNQFARGVFAMVGAMSAESFQTFHSYANTFQMPFVTPWYPVTMERPGLDFASRVQPPDLHRAIVDTISYYGWKNIIYFYNTYEGLLRLQSVFQGMEVKNDSLRVAIVRKVASAKDALSILRNIELSSRWSNKYVILDCPTALAKDIIISHVRDIHLGRRTYHYLVAGLAFDENWDPATVEFGAVNVTGFRIVDTNKPLVSKFMEKWSTLDPSTFPGAGTKSISATAAFMYDGVSILKETFTRLLNADVTSLRRNSSRVFTCATNQDAIDTNQISVRQFEHGDMIARELKKVDIEGLTGHIKFSSNGTRTAYAVDVMEMAITSQMVKIGEWKQGLGFVTNSQKSKFLNKTKFNPNITYIVTTILEEPYMMLKNVEKGEPQPNGNDRYEGFCKDLASHIAEQLKIDYKIQVVKDGGYGAENLASPGGWDGMVGELIRGDAHLAVAPLTISRSRQEVIDFSMPFMELGISIMVKKPQVEMPGAFSFVKPMRGSVWSATLGSIVIVAVVLILVQRNPTNTRLYTIRNALWFSIASVFRQGTPINPREIGILQEADLAISALTITAERERVIDFSKPFMSLGISIMIYKPKKPSSGVFGFMSPLSTETWLCVLLAYVTVSFILYLVTRFNPTEWLAETQGRLHSQFSIPNALWFSFAALVQQGSDRSPRSFAGRLVGSVWWFFTLILISSYTANFAAVRTVNRMVYPIKSADDLSMQHEVQYGTLARGSTWEFFRRSELAVFKRMWEFMTITEGVNVRSYDEGIRKVRERKGKYALLVESPKNDYTNQRKPCDTMKVGSNLDAKGFGVATPIGSTLKHRINLIVLQAKESGQLGKWENHWWYEKSKCDSGNKQEPSTTDDELSLGSLAGIFYILIVGLVIAMAVAFGEFCYKSNKDAKKSQISLSEAMKAKARVTIAGPDTTAAVPNSCNSHSR